MCKSAADHDEQTIKAAIRAFRHHHLIRGDRDDGRWFIARKYDDGTIDGIYATEIISLRGGRLFVGGDIDDCVFAYYSAPSDMPSKDFHENKLRWIGRCQDVSYYVAQKARIGLSDDGLITSEWNNEVALHELRELMEDIPEGTIERTTLNYAQDACVRDEGEESVLSHLQDALDEIPDRFGRVTSPRVIYAWAACRKLCQILNGPATDKDDDRYAKYDTDDNTVDVDVDEEKNDGVQ